MDRPEGAELSGNDGVLKAAPNAGLACDRCGTRGAAFKNEGTFLFCPDRTGCNIRKGERLAVALRPSVAPYVARIGDKVRTTAANPFEFRDRVGRVTLVHQPSKDVSVFMDDNGAFLNIPAKLVATHLELDDSPKSPAPSSGVTPLEHLTWRAIAHCPPDLAGALRALLTKGKA